METEQDGTEVTEGDPEAVRDLPPKGAQPLYRAYCLVCGWNDTYDDGRPVCLDLYSAKSRGQMHGDANGLNWDVREC
jgi:hypothetical protein